MKHATMRKKSLNVMVIMVLNFFTLLASNQPIAMDELETLVLKNNPDIKSAFENWRAAVSSIAVARALPDPRFSYTEFIEEVQTRVGPQRRKFDVNQMFPWFGTLDLREDKAVVMAAALEQRMEMVRWQSLLELKLSLYEENLLERKISIEQEQLQILENLEEAMRGKMSSGKANLASILRVQVERERLKDDLVGLESARKPFRKNIEKVVGQGLEGLTLPQNYSFTNAIPEAEALRRAFVQNNPRYKASQLMESQSLVEVSIAKNMNKPELSLGFSWIDTGKTAMGTGGDDPLAVMFSMSLPLWQSKNSARVQASRENVASMHYQTASVLNQFEAQLEMALYKIDEAERKIKLYGESLLSRTKNAFESVKQSHEVGNSSFQDVLDTQRVLLILSLGYEVAKTDRVKTIANLESMVGPL